MKLLRKQCEVCDVIKDEKQASGFSVLTADELYEICGGGNGVTIESEQDSEKKTHSVSISIPISGK